MADSLTKIASAVLTLSQDGVLVLDSDLAVVFANDTVAEWTGRNLSDVLGRPGAVLWDDSRRWEDWLAGYRHHGGSTPEEALELQTAAGDPFPVKVRLASQSGGFLQSRRLVLLMQDQRPQKLLERLVRYDGLTGVLSRSEILDGLEAELAQMRRFGTPLGMIFMDIDGFKAHNDLWGPEFGDQILRVAGAEIRESVSSSGRSGRTGSDEFLVLLPQATAVGTEDVALRIRGGLSRRLFAPQGIEVPVTASFALSSIQSSEPVSLASLLVRLSDTLGRARGRGRGRVEFTS